MYVSFSRITRMLELLRMKYVFRNQVMVYEPRRRFRISFWWVNGRARTIETNPQLVAVFGCLTLKGQ